MDKDKFQNKYRIPSARLQNWDYASNGAYFITICTKNMEHYFGEIPETEMVLNEMGKLAEQYWIEIPQHFPFVELGNFVIMPNHVHGILMIDKPDDFIARRNSDGINMQMANVQTMDVQTLHAGVQTLHATSLASDPKNQQMATISPKSGSVSTIIRSYKSAVSKDARQIHADFEWQTRFHDHIIRNAESFERIDNYIASNPANWNMDKFNNYCNEAK